MQQLSNKKVLAGNKQVQLGVSKDVSAHGFRDPLMGAQQTIGNHGLLGRQGEVIQAKLKIGASNDKYEQEADRVAELVMQMPEPHLQRQEEDEEEEKDLIQMKPVGEQITPLVQRQAEEEEDDDDEKKIIQTKVASGQASEVTSNMQAQIAAMRGGGRPLPKSTRMFLETRFGTKFHRVRVHTNARAAAIARKFNARAFTVRNNIVFGAEQYNPVSALGRRLIAHELAHVIQQQPRTVTEASRINIISGVASGSAAHQVLQGQLAKLSVSGSLSAVQCQEATIRKRALASRKQVEAAVRTYLECVKREQGGRTVQITPSVRLDLRKLAETNSPMWRGPGNDPGRISRAIQLDILLKTPGPRDPAGLAKAVAKILPDPFNPAALRSLRTCSVKQKPSLSRRAQRILKPPLPGKPAHPKPVSGPSSQERFEKVVEDMLAQQGKEGPKVVGPYGGDVLAPIRKVRKIFKPKSPPKTPPPARRFPKVEKAIRQNMKHEDLVPAEVISRLKRAWNAYEKAREVDQPSRLKKLNEVREASRQYKTPLAVAHELANRLDKAHKQGSPRVRLELDPLYNRALDRAAILKKVERIILLVRDHLPHRTRKVQRVEITIGGKIARVVGLGTSRSSPSGK